MQHVTRDTVSFHHVDVDVLAGTFAFSWSLANSPLHRMQCCGVTSRKQSPLFSDLTEGSTSLTCTCRLPVNTGTSSYEHMNIQNTDHYTDTQT